MKSGVMIVCALKALTFAEAKAAVLTLPARGSAVCRIEWWDTRTAEIIRRETASPNGGSLNLTISPFGRDIALRVAKLKKRT